MKYDNCLSVALVLAAAAPVVSATKEQEPPDKEMLKMMDLLREMEMLKQIEMMREMHSVESAGAQAQNSVPRKTAPVGKKEIAK